MRVATFFSGYDSQCMALDRLGVDYELVAWSEIDEYAIRAHNAVYPQWEDRNFGDIEKIVPEELPDFDLMTYSSPCQDFSVVGTQAGGEKGSGTRSSLLWCCEEIIRVKRPKFLLMENVKALNGQKFKPLLKKWQEVLEGMGYVNFAKVLDAKDFGIPQHRERLFMVSILGGGEYEWPEKQELKLRLKDVLESGEVFNATVEGLCRTIKAQYFKNSLANFMKQGDWGATGVLMQVGNIYPDTEKFKNRTMGRIYHPNGISPTLNTCGGGDRQPKILVGEDKIRKLTPRECFRLMGVSEEDIDRLMSCGLSNTRLYQMAGNSIVVQVLVEVLRPIVL